MAKRKGRIREANRRTVPLRVQKHLARLGLDSTKGYLTWCRKRGFRSELVKSWSELHRECLANTAEQAEFEASLRVERHPGKLLAAVCAGTASSGDAARPRWRELAERIERAELDSAARRALGVLIEVANRRGKLLLAEGCFGDTVYPYLDGLIVLCGYRDQWLRPPWDWRGRAYNARRQFSSLLRHLLTRYSVPPFMDAAWLRRDAAAEHYRDWFVRLGRGENIRGAESPIPLTNRIIHHFLHAPDDYGIEQALRRGQILALGGDQRTVEAILATRLAASFEHNAFWTTLIRFLIENPALPRHHVGPIVDYIYHQRFASEEVFVAPGILERRGPPRPHLSMKGRSPDALLRQVERWHRDLARTGAHSTAQWPSTGIGGFELQMGTQGRNLRVWRIRELLTAAALVAEGRAMRHCVASYVGCCRAGRVSIWAMELHSFEGVEKRQTIEVTAKRIVQCRGRFNRLPNDQEWQVLVRWAQQQGLALTSFLRAA